MNQDKNFLIVIPALKKNAVIPDQLVKKLNGITLIQRAINIAKKLSNNILVITDSEEIGLISERNNVSFFKDSKLRIDPNNIIQKVIELVDKLERKERYLLIYRANTPLVDETVLKKAYKEFLREPDKILVSVRGLDKQILYFENHKIKRLYGKAFFKELKSFFILDRNHTTKFKPFLIEKEKSIEIETYQDWWICEKLLQRKRIIFHVIGNTKVGMGHIFRCYNFIIF